MTEMQVTINYDNAGYIPVVKCRRCSKEQDRIPMLIERRWIKDGASRLEVVQWTKPDGWNYLIDNEGLYCPDCFQLLSAAIHRIIEAT